MTTPNIITRAGAELTARDVYEIWRIRDVVFAVEQQCDEPDVDGVDLYDDCVHLWIADDDGIIQSYLRTYVADGHRKIGRVATRKEARGQGLSGTLLREVLARWGTDEIHIGAQAYLEDWYGTFGFVTTGGHYLDAGIDHVPMTRRPNTSPTGRRETREGRESLVLERTFRAPVEDVWAAITESDRLGRWIGTWTGDPADGTVQFQMNAEGDDVPSEPFAIHRCERPHLLSVSSPAPDDADPFELVLGLSEQDGTTTLTFSQAMTDPELAANVGPGWEYYLDRLVAAEAGDDVSAISFDDYYPAQSDHYRGLFS